MKKSILFHRCPGRVRGRSRRGAALYVTVLGTSLLVTVIALSSIEIARARLRSADLAGDAGQARLIAISAIEVALTYCNSTPDWRTTLAGGSTKLMPFGDSNVQFQALDDVDGDLLNDVRQPVRLIGTGVYGSGRYRASVLARPLPVSCLEVALHAANNLIFSAATVNCNQTISANNSVIESGSIINADVEAANAIAGTGYTETTTTGIAPRSMPAATVFDYYKARGTPIDVASLPLDATSGLPAIQLGVLSPATNPYGTREANLQGIYVIDCKGLSIQIQDCRIVGTLVLLNPGSSSEVRNAVNWQPAVANFPALLVQGPMNFNFDTTQPLGEGAPWNTNFNPPSTPYKADWDDDMLDAYPTMIRGLVYVSGDVTTSLRPAFDGVLVVGMTLNTSGNLRLSYQSIYLNNPPPGFVSPKVNAVHGSWRQEPEP